MDKENTASLPFWQTWRWKVFQGIVLTGILASSTFFCSFSFAWFQSDRGNGVYLWNPYFIWIMTSAITLIFLFFYLLWCRVSISVLAKLYAILSLLIVTLFPLKFIKDRQRNLLVLDRYQQFSNAINSEDWEAAYSFMSPEYRQRIPPEKFEDDVRFLIGLTYHSKFDRLQAVNVYAIHVSNRNGFVAPYESITLTYHPPGGTGWLVENVAGEWYFTGAPTFFID